MPASIGVTLGYAGRGSKGEETNDKREKLKGRT